MSDKPKRPRSRTTPQETVPLQVSGLFLDRVSTIPTGSASLIATLGEANGKSYLVPFVDLSLTEELLPDEALSDDPDGEEAFSRIVTLDNAAHIVRLLAGELTDVFRDYELMVSERAGPEPSRFQVIQAYLKEARDSLDVASGIVERILQRPI